MIFTKNTKMDILCENPEMKELAPYMVYCGKQEFPQDFYGMTIEDKCRKDGWNLSGVLNGINFLYSKRKEKKADIHWIYSEECETVPEKKAVNIVRIVPEKIDEKKPYIVLCAGGGYCCVCSMVEAYPVAAQMVQRGYQVFVLTYRVNKTPVLPAALQDLAAALRYIDGSAEKFHVKPENYILGGFSAGANLAGNWGTTSAGYHQFGINGPKAMFLVYAPIISGTPVGGNADNFMIRMYGRDFKMEDVEKYFIDQKLDSDYPPCYIVCGSDDQTVPCVNSETLHRRLSELGVKNYLEEGSHAPHGFGDGTGTDVEGWPMRAIDFYETL